MHLVGSKPPISTFLKMLKCNAFHVQSPGSECPLFSMACHCLQASCCGDVVIHACTEATTDTCGMHVSGSKETPRDDNQGSCVGRWTTRINNISKDSEVDLVSRKWKDRAWDRWVFIHQDSGQRGDSVMWGNMTSVIQEGQALKVEKF